MPMTNVLLPDNIVGPGTGQYPVLTNPGGAVIFVSSAIGQDNRRRLTFQGTAATVTQSASAQGPYGDPNKPMASVFGPNGALTAVQAGRGDLIVCLPGHVEIIPGGVISIPGGINVLGIGYGSSRPQFQYTTATTVLTPTGSGIQFQNCIFDLTQVAAVTLGFSIAFSGFQCINCRIIMASATNQAVCAFSLLVGADDFSFVNSEIDADAAAGAAFGIKNIAANAINRPFIQGSWIHGDFSTAPLSILTTTTKEIYVGYSIFKNLNAAKTIFNLATGNTITGQFFYNSLISPNAGGHGDFIAGGTGTGITWFQNFGAAVSAHPTSAILIPDVGTVP